MVAYQPGVPDPKNDYAKGVYGADLDDDGDIDIAYVSEGNNEVGWLENIGGAPPAFVPHILGNNADHAKTVLATDFDRDGDLDLLVASSGDNKITWFINDGQQPANFTAVLMTTSAMPTWTCCPPRAMITASPGIPIPPFTARPSIPKPRKG